MWGFSNWLYFYNTRFGKLNNKRDDFGERQKFHNGYKNFNKSIENCNKNYNKRFEGIVYVSNSDFVETPEIVHLDTGY